MGWRLLERFIPCAVLHRVACSLLVGAMACGVTHAQERSEKPTPDEAAVKKEKEAAAKELKKIKKEAAKKQDAKQEVEKKDANKKDKDTDKKEANKKEPDKKELGKKEKPGSPAKPGGFSPEREAAALAFVREHHAELADLVASLKQNHPGEYQRAIRDLVKVNESLTQLRTRDQNKYELDLQAWKLRSRIELLAVRLKMNAADESLRGELKQLLGEQFAIQQSLLQLERERTQAKLDQIDKKLKHASGTSDEYVERQLQTLLHGKKTAKENSTPAPSPTGRGPG